MRPRRRLVAGVLALVLAGLMVQAPATAQSPSTDLTPAEREWLAQHGPLRLVVGQDVPPTIFPGATGQAQGIAIDLLNLIDVKLGVPYVVLRAPNQTEAIDMVRRGQADFLGPIAAAPEREAYLEHTKGWITGSIAFWTATDSPLRERGELAGKRVAAVQQGVSSRWLRDNLPAATVVPVNNTLEGLQKASRGEVEAFLGGLAPTAYLVQNGAVSGIRALDQPVETVDGSWAVAEGQVTLLAILTKGMASISPAERTHVFTKWTGYDLTPTTERPPFEFDDAQKALIGAAVLLILGLAAGTVLLRRKVASRTRELRTVIEAAPVGIVTVDATGRLKRANPTAARLLGRSPEALRGIPVEELVPPEDRDLSARDLGDIVSGARDHVSVERRAVRGDGTLFWAQVDAAAVRAPDGRFLQAVVMFTDLTERRKAEAQRAAHLERMVEVERLKELDRLRNAFLSTAAHELNTPLTPIMLQLQVLEKEALTEPQARSLAVVQRNVLRLERLIRDLLDASRLQAGRLRLEPGLVEVDALVREAVEAHRESARLAGVTIAATPGARGLLVRADATRIAQVLDNLLGNAVKFTPAGGRVHVETTARDGGLVVRVEDTGPGIRPEELERLFQPFSQLAAGDALGSKGTGLGLFISKGIVEMHGGRLWCESRGEGQGSAFVFFLPPGGAPVEPSPVAA